MKIRSTKSKTDASTNDSSGNYDNSTQGQRGRLRRKGMLALPYLFVCLLIGVCNDIAMKSNRDVFHEERVGNTVTATSTSTSTSDDNNHAEWFEKREPLISDWPILEKRLHVVPLLEKMKLKRGIEVGVQRGVLAKKTLSVWKSCEEYKLVDLWGKEDQYKEPNARAQNVHDSYLRETRGRMKPWVEKNVVEFLIMRSTDAAKSLSDDHFDYIYLDARHDFCAVKEDIEHYYPKLRPGGILGGHDYTDSQYAIDKLGEKEDWSKCEDGSSHPEGVKGAVDNFVKENHLSLVTSKEDFPSWYVQKPYH